MLDGPAVDDLLGDAAGGLDRHGEADPDVALEVPPVAIWELIPTTSPSAPSSGPPELPGLIAASVWMT